MSLPTRNPIVDAPDPLVKTDYRSRQHLVPSPNRTPLAGVAWAYQEDDAVPLDQVQALIAAAGSGAATTLEEDFVAGANLGGNRLVYILAGVVYHFDYTDISLWGKLLGFTKASATIGSTVTVVKAGKMVNPGWGLTPDTVYYADSNGLITATPPTSNLDIPVGLAIDANTLEINIFEQVIL